MSIMMICILRSVIEYYYYYYYMLFRKLVSVSYGIEAH